jgi:hypothetical protein
VLHGDNPYPNCVIGAACQKVNVSSAGKGFYSGGTNRKRKPDVLHDQGGFRQSQRYYGLETAHYPESTGYNLAIPAGAGINDIIERSNCVAGVAIGDYIKNGVRPEWHLLNSIFIIKQFVTTL